MRTKNTSSDVSVFDGTDDIIHNALGLHPGQCLKQISTCRSLCNSRLPEGFSPEIVPRLFDRVVENWYEISHGRRPSFENWRHERQTYIGNVNKSPEVILERAIATLAEFGDLPEWYNQIPVASGLLNGKSDKRAALDLVRVEGDTAELIELKWNSDTPLFALFQVLGYGLALLLSRQNAEVFGYSGRPLMEARRLSLVVLAPAQYYSKFWSGGQPREGNHFWDIADVLKLGLDLLTSRHSGFPSWNLKLLKFPNDFEIPFRSGAQVNAMRADDKTKERSQLLRAISSLQPVRN